MSLYSNLFLTTWQFFHTFVVIVKYFFAMNFTRKAPKSDIDYYRVLQLNKDCNNLEIKTAFRRLAIHYNPERLRDESIQEVFALIAEAYEVLSDPLKRAIYDQYGETGLKGGVSGPNGHIPSYVFHKEPLQTFRQLFGMSDSLNDILRIFNDPEMMDSFAKGKGIKIKDKPIKKPLQLSLKEIFYGGMKKIKIQKLIFADAEKTHTNLKEKILTVPIKPGLPTGTEIIFTEEGDQGPNRIPADMIFTTEDKTHEIYTREGDNLLMTVDVVLKDALLGTVVTVHTLDDRTFRIPITSIITPDYRKCIPGEGLPLLQNPNERGDLIINFKIDFPIYLPVASKNYVKKAFDILEKDVTK